MRYLLNFLLDIDKSYGKIYKSGMTFFGQTEIVLTTIKEFF